MPVALRDASAFPVMIVPIDGGPWWRPGVERRPGRVWEVPTQEVAEAVLALSGRTRQEVAARMLTLSDLRRAAQ
eukprot:14468339-Alexandrium_andersonii.AAC.1